MKKDFDTIQHNGFTIIKAYGESRKDKVIVKNNEGYLFYLGIGILINNFRRNCYPDAFLHGNIFTPINIKLFLEKNKRNIELASKNASG